MSNAINYHVCWHYMQGKESQELSYEYSVIKIATVFLYLNQNINNDDEK